MYVDSHCHLDFPEFTPELDAVLKRARAAGVRHFLTISTGLARFPAVRGIAELAPDISCTIGVHPHDAAKEPVAGPELLLAESGHQKVVGFGETGLDYYYQHSPREAQIRNFHSHIAAARACGLPVVIHTRDAEEDTISILEAEQAIGQFSGVIHCFTGSARLAGAALELGFYISVSGIATFRKSEILRATLKEVPLNRLLVETDCPYLAPEPMRGKRNEPAYVVHTAAMLAQLKGVTPAELAVATTENFYRLFSKANPFPAA
jgi:TatD DNase family protein